MVFGKILLVYMRYIVHLILSHHKIFAMLQSEGGPFIDG